MKNKLIKGFTLVMFSTLLISFSAYKSGYFGGQKFSYSVSPNGSPINNYSDTISKIDSLKLKKRKDIKLDSSAKLKPLIYSSKSGIIFKSEDLNKIEFDSITTDSLKK